MKIKRYRPLLQRKSVLLSNEELKTKLLKDFKKIVNKEINFNLVVKDECKSYYGRYNPKKREIIVYNGRRKYKDFLKTFFHEYVHLIQIDDVDYEYKKGVMHDEEFYILLNYYNEKIEEYLR